MTIFVTRLLKKTKFGGIDMPECIYGKKDRLNFTYEKEET